MTTIATRAAMTAREHATRARQISDTVGHVDSLGGQTEALVNTNLALFEEQRTANLIAYWVAMTNGRPDGLQVHTPQEAERIHRLIRDRLILERRTS